MTIPLSVLLIPAAIIVALVIIFAFVNLLQIVRFGFWGIAAMVAFTVFLTMAAIISMQTLAALSGVDWNAPLITTDIGDSSDIFGN